LNRRFGTIAYYPDIDHSKITIEKTKNPATKLPKEELKFGQKLSDHILEVDWKSGSGWTAPRIVPLHDLQISPAANVFHYSTACFEGLKAYLDKDDHILLFRPDKNMARLQDSFHRIVFPDFNAKQFFECLKDFVRVEKSWIPKGVGYSLYLRPTAIGTAPGLGVGPSTTLKLFVVASPVGPYYPQGWKPVSLLADSKYCRAWPGGMGGNKMGANYANSILPQVEAMKQGFSQVLWLFGDNYQVTEVGTMNIFFYWKNKKGKNELITAPLDGTILPGVTRDSILAIARKWKEFEVTEAKYTIHDVIEASKEGRLLEAFGAGTAAIVSPVEAISFKGQKYPVPLDASDPKAKIGKLTQRFADTIMDIQYGKTEHEWSVKVD